MIQPQIVNGAIVYSPRRPKAEAVRPQVASEVPGEGRHQRKTARIEVEGIVLGGCFSVLGEMGRSGFRVDLVEVPAEWNKWDKPRRNRVLRALELGLEHQLGVQVHQIQQDRVLEREG